MDISQLREWCRERNEKINIAILYLVSRAINARPDYRMFYDFKKDEVRCYDRVNPTHYVFDPKTETCHTVNTPYDPDYAAFYKRALRDTEDAKKSDYAEPAEKPDYFNASVMPWVSYGSFSIELPDGYLYFNPNVNWGRFFEKDGKVFLPLTIRLNHAIADGYLVSKFFLLFEEGLQNLVAKKPIRSLANT
jgi:chloramphenicol O-acetyltransferase type A